MGMIDDLERMYKQNLQPYLELKVNGDVVAIKRDAILAVWPRRVGDALRNPKTYCTISVEGSTFNVDQEYSEVVAMLNPDIGKIFQASREELAQL